MSDRAPPIWMVVTAQLVSVVGDALGQRAQRKVFKSSSRRMLISLTLVSGVQVLVVLAMLQLLWAQLTAPVYVGSHKATCYEEVDVDGRYPDYCDSHQCTVIDCPAQGPFSIFKSLALHPLLLLNGVQSVGYYVGEVLLYDEPLGLVFIVMAAMASSLVIAPFEALFGIVDHSQSPLVIVLGTVGALLCVMEIRRRKSKAAAAATAAATTATTTTTTTSREPPTLQTQSNGKPRRTSASFEVESPESPTIESGGITIPLKHKQQQYDSNGSSSDSNGLLAGSHDSLEDEIADGTPSNAPYFKLHDPAANSFAEHNDLRGKKNKRAKRHKHSANVTSSRQSHFRRYDEEEEDEQHLLVRADDEQQQRREQQQLTDGRTNVSPWRRALRIGLPFLFLSLVYSTWFVSQKLFNDKYRLNAWGYTSLDQVLGPFYLLPTLWLVDQVPSLRRCLVPQNEQRDPRSFLGSAREAMREMLANRGEGLLTVFMYRLLINARAIAYFYFAVQYDLSVVYLELQLTRVVLSWIASFLLVWGMPRFISVTEAERANVLYLPNIGLKLLGTGFVVAALSIVNN